MKKVISFAPLPAEMIKNILVDKTGLSDIEVVGVHGMSEEEVVGHVSDALVFFGDFSHPARPPITGAIIKAAKKLKFVQQPSLGYDQVDDKACKEAGVQLANAAGAIETSVAELTIGLAIILARKVVRLSNLVQSGGWIEGPQIREAGPFELAGKKWGILGMGNTGREVAKRIKPFGVEIAYFKRNRYDPDEEEKLEIKYELLDDILKTCDIISIHFPLTEETEWIIGEREIGLIKNNALVINMGRGKLVDEKALAEALEQNKIGGAAFDVFENEPIEKDNPLLGLDNVILTPHMGGMTHESAPKVFAVAIENVARMLKGEEPINLIV